PVTWIVTEFASAYDAYIGWDYPGWRTAEQTADEWAQAAAWYAEHSYYMIPFTYLEWQMAFRYYNTDVIKDRLVTVNREHPVLISNPPAPPTEPEEPPVAQIVNMQDHVCPVDGALYHLNSGETMQCGYDASGYGRQYKNALW